MRLLENPQRRVNDDHPSIAAHRNSSYVLDVFRIARPIQWVKNVYVLAPLLFGGAIFRPAAVLAAILAFASFCLWSSAVYCLNDVLDSKADRSHPRKKNRPIASGRFSVSAAIVVGLVLVAGGLITATLPPLPVGFVWFGGLYLGNSLLYCIILKHRVIADVIAISIGFVIRLLAGCWAVGVQPSQWLIICGFSLALLLGFGKRRLELGSLDSPVEFRPSLQSYTVMNVNMLLSITTAICLLAYMLYTVSAETVQIHHSQQLVYTVPFVAYGLFRYLFKVQEGKHDGPVEILIKDWVFLLNGLLWLFAIVVIVYGQAHLENFRPR